VNWYWDALNWAGEHTSVARFAGIRTWLIENQPEHERSVLCHGDANFTNMLFTDNAVSTVLDWEMAFIGTPECDISYTLLAMSSLTTDYPEGVPSPDEMIAAYEQASGSKLQNMPYYTLFSIYRLVVIVTLGLRA